MKIKTVILTGFQPFGPYVYNPTEESTTLFHGKEFGDRKVVGIVLPCVYDTWAHLVNVVSRTSPYAIINTGLSSSVKGFRIESTFRNVMNGKYPDANGYEPKGERILHEPHAPESVKSCAANKKLYELLLSNGIPAERSKNAEAFICNALGYNVSLATRNYDYVQKNMFVHIPWTSDYRDRVALEEGKIFLDKEKYHQGLELLIRNI